MNREIKFRAWNKTEKWMDEEFSIDADGCVYQPARTIWNMGDIAVETAYDDLVVMQFTGLKDKNGKEIYEGDVVRYTTRYLDHPRDFRIVFSDGMFCQIEISPRGYVDEGEETGMWIDWEDLTIIGNIYENPELLNDAQK